MFNNEKSFLDLGLNSDFSKALYNIGYINPFPIQIKCIPKLINGYDLIGVAQTGSGKTAAFIIPFINKINLSNNFTQILIIEPTRELVLQVSKVASLISSKIKKINIVSIYGGQNYNLQFKNLRNNPHLVIGTPGRLLDHLNRKTLNLSNINGLVLDEADEMLKMGFLKDIEKILFNIPKNCQTALFSATMPKDIKKLAYKFTKSPIEIKLNDNINLPNIKQSYWIVKNVSKNEALLRFIELTNFCLCIVFIKTKNATLEISSILRKFNYKSSYLNGDLNQNIREKTINLFKLKKINILVATDIASRGLDVNNVDLIINYDAPFDLNTYIHRIGRTGRAGKSGRAITFIKSNEFFILKKIKLKYKSIIKYNLPNIKDINENRFNKMIEKIKKYNNDNNINIYKEYIDKLLFNINNDKDKLLLILYSLYQKEKHLIISSIIDSK